MEPKTIKCPKCGHERNIDDGLPQTECPKCGIIYKKASAKQKGRGKPELQGELNKSSNSNYLIAITIVICLFIIAFLYFGFRKTIGEREKQISQLKLELIEYKTKYKNLLSERKRQGPYFENFSKTYSTLQSSAFVCIKMGKQYAKVWREALNKGNDFDDAIASQYKTNKKNGSIETIEEDKKKIEDLMKELKNPPSIYIEPYGKIVKLFGIYAQLYDLAYYPSGSLLIYINKIGALRGELIKEANEIKALLQ